jgi:hypothetical protein
MSTLPARFWAKVNKTDTCWLWTAKVRKGYGQFWFEGQTRLAHRVAYEAIHGPIDVLLDHKCFRHECVNPDHLRPATHKQNAEHRQGAQANSKTGLRGVTRRPNGRYRAKIRHNGISIDCGTYATAEEAAAAWQAKADELFTHHRLAA